MSRGTLCAYPRCMVRMCFCIPEELLRTLPQLFHKHLNITLVEFCRREVSKALKVHPHPHLQPNLQPHCHSSPNIILSVIPNLTPIITHSPKLVSTVIPISNPIPFIPTPNVLLLISILTIPIPKLIHIPNLIPAAIPILTIPDFTPIITPSFTHLPLPWGGLSKDEVGAIGLIRALIRQWARQEGAGDVAGEGG